MALIVTSNEQVREKPEAGIHDAVCVMVADIGTHTNQTEWGLKDQHQIIILWELDEEMKSGKYAGKPFMMSKTFNFTLFEKGNLSKYLESWLGKKIPDSVRKTGFDLHTLIGKRCTVNLIESEDGKYMNIGSVMPPNKTNALIPVCQELPAWIQQKIDSSNEAMATNTDPAWVTETPVLEKPYLPSEPEVEEDMPWDVPQGGKQ